MRYLIAALVVCAGCFTSEGLRNSQACISDHAERQVAALTEIARLTADNPLSPRMAELLRDSAMSASRVQAWTQLTQEQLGRATAPPEIMTEAEVGAQALYRQEIELRRKLKEMIPFQIPGAGGSSSGLGSLGTALAGGGPFALVSTIAGIFLKRKSAQARKLKEEKAVSDAAVAEAMKLIRTSPDPEIRKRAGKEPNLVRRYADAKAEEYQSRIMQIEHGAQEEEPT